MRYSLLAPLLLLTAAPIGLQAQHPFTYERDAPAKLTDSLVEVREGIEYRDFWFPSPRGGRASGRLYLPSGSQRAPLVLYGHGAPGDSRGFATTTNAVALAMQGAVVLVLDAPFARRGGDPIAFTLQDSVEQVQFAVDWQRAIDLLVSHEAVDSTRIGFMGNSYGAAQGALLVGIEPRIRAAVLRVGDGGFLAHFTDPCESVTGVASIDGCLRWSIGEDDLSVADRERWAAAMRPIEPIRYVGQSRAAILFQQARDDTAVSPARAERLHAAGPTGSSVMWYPSGHRLPPEALLDGIGFLRQHLGLRAPDAALLGWLESRRPKG